MSIATHPLRRMAGVLLLLGLVPRLSTGQTTALLTGKVIDATTNQPIPYASIGVLRGRQGTNSNADGEFTLKVSELPVRLVVGDLGHVRDTVTVTTATTALQVRLQPATVLLPEVQLGTYTTTLLRQAARQLRAAHGQKHYVEAFYRQITRLDGEPIELQEMIWHARTDNAGMDGTAVAQGRFAKKKVRGAQVSFTNMAKLQRTQNFFTAAADSNAAKSIFGPNAAQHYTLSLLGTSQNGAQQLVEIGFRRKPDPQLPTAEGSLVIDADTYQILRLRLRAPSSTNSNNPLFKFKDVMTTQEWFFQPTAGGGAAPTLLKLTHTATIAQPLKRDVHVAVEAFTSFYDQQPAPVAGATYGPPAAGETDLQTIKATAYNPAFWQQNSAVQRTPLEEQVIKAFEQKGAFGTMLTP